MSYAFIWQDFFLCSTCVAGIEFTMKNIIVAVIQILFVLLFFHLYEIKPIFSLLYCAFFVLLTPFTLKFALNNYLKANKHLFFLAFSLICDIFFTVMLFANAYELFGTVNNNGVPLNSLLDFTYFSVVTFTTLGYGDYLPTGAAQIIAMIEVLVGFVFFSFLIGIVSAIFYERMTKASNKGSH